MLGSSISVMPANVALSVAHTWAAQQTFTAGIVSGANIVSDTDDTDYLGSSTVGWAGIHIATNFLLDQLDVATLALRDSARSTFKYLKANLTCSQYLEFANAASLVKTNLTTTSYVGFQAYGSGALVEHWRLAPDSAIWMSRPKIEATAYTASGAIGNVGTVELNQAGSALAMTLADPGDSGFLLVITQIDAGTQGHTVTTATAGGFDGTNNTATFNAQTESLALYSISATRWIILENVGAVGLSAV